MARSGSAGRCCLIDKINNSAETASKSPCTNRTELDNGIRVLTEKIPGVHSVSVGIWAEVGARDETADLSGISHFIEHMIFKGTRRRNALEIAREFDRMGGYSNAFTSRELTCFHVKVLDSSLDNALDILADIFLNSLFDKVELDRERGVIMQEISMVEDSPDDYIHEIFNTLFWGESELGRSILGTAETVSAMDSSTLKGFVRQSYTGSRVVISAAGNVDHNHFTEKIRGHFSSVGSIGKKERKTAPAPVVDSIFINRDTEQCHIIIGCPGPAITDEDRYTAILLNDLLGGSMSSRLFQEIREKRGLAYSVYSYLSSLHDAGVAGMYAGVAPENSAEVIRLMNNELENLATRPVSSDELEGSREHALGAMLLSAEVSDARMMKLARDEVHFNRYIPFEEITERLKGVTPGAIMELAGRYVDSGLSMACLGPMDEKGVESCRKALAA